uniref:Retrovirus-related Pol polyprotein from transposon TNT 1-94-like beta-barrel domain-containing protein n=1 Tax=Fagus sylvatica TaxID=28930 RepID=A0A2N9G9X1_FAGSY
MTTSSLTKYAYPSNLNVANFVSLKLTSTNFLLWETQVISLIESQDLIGFITGTISAPVAEIQNSTEDGMMPNPDLAAWTRTDRLIKAWITATISEEALGTVVGLTTSLDVWKALSNTYSQDSQAREFELLLKLQEKKKDMVPLNDFIRNFKLTCDQLNAIGKPVPDQKKQWPFVGQRFNSNKGPQSSFNSRGKGFHQSGSRPPYTPRNAQQQSHSKNQTQSGSNTASQAGPLPVCQICKKRGHHALKCWHRFDNSYQDDHVPQALAALHLNSPTAGEWVPDTGATAHITDDPGTLSKLTPYAGSDSVMVGNGSELSITYTGHARIFSPGSSLSLNNVLVVPDIKKNLLSVSQLTSDYPCYFIFDDRGFVIKDLRTHKVLASGSKEDGLYVLQRAPVRVFFSNRFRVVDSTILAWTARTSST